MAGDNPPFSFSTPEAPVYSRARSLPPTQIGDSTIRNSLLADGCRIGKGAVIENSVIGLRCVVGENAQIRNSIVMGADFWDSELAAEQASHVPLGIGDGSVIDGAIVDKNCRIGSNVSITNPNNVDSAQAAEGAIVVRDGIPIVVKDSTIQNGFKLEV